jgi:hypothetical protein
MRNDREESYSITPEGDRWVKKFQKWELVVEEEIAGTWRLSVPGGWLYLHAYRPLADDPDEQSRCMVFVPGEHK